MPPAEEREDVEFALCEIIHPIIPSRTERARCSVLHTNDLLARGLYNYKFTLVNRFNAELRAHWHLLPSNEEGCNEDAYLIRCDGIFSPTRFRVDPSDLSKR